MFIQSNAITKTANLAIDILAGLPVIDPVAVADVEAELGAVPPDGVLHEPRENGRERRIEGPGVNLLGHQTNNVSAAAWPVAARPIEMVGVEPSQDPGALQKVVHQGVDGDHRGADLPPGLVTPRRRQQDAGQGHGQHLVRHPVDLPQRLDQGGAQPGRAVGIMRAVGFSQLPVDPADQITIGDVADEQIKRIGGLVEPTVAQVVARHWATVDMIGLGTSAADLVVPATMVVPVALELGAGAGIELGALMHRRRCLLVPMRDSIDASMSAFRGGFN
jgi:hypothetical protein